MALSNRNILLAFFLIAAISIFFLMTGNVVGYYIFKPLIVPILLFLLFRHLMANTHEVLPPLIIATVFSWLGDILSIIPVDEAFYKMCAICTFVVAQACYAYVFYLSTKTRDAIKRITWSQRLPEAFCILVFIVTMYLITPYLGVFLISGYLYALVASTAIILGINRRFYVSTKSFYRVIIGISFFFISDVLTGMDVFQTDYRIHSIILLSYVLGHYFVISGMLTQINEESENVKASEKDAFTKSYS